MEVDARNRKADVSRQRPDPAWAPYARADAEAIRAPTLLVAGERSPASFHHVLDGLETALKDVRRVVIPSASHASNLDNPQAFERVVLAFLVGR
jgi:pimeloyl-ACP methyl ester carboxylesterase